MATGSNGMQVEMLAAGLRDNNGDPLNAGKVYSYQPGTTTNATLYTTATIGTGHPNPLVLDAYGRAAAFGNRAYDFVITDSAGATLQTLSNFVYDHWRESNDGAGSTLDADLLDSRNAGNANGNIPISNGTVNTNLNADLLDGLNSGNATGNIPINSGTVNVGLNADYLDGANSGNATGNIPINNGTENVGLNANYLQGKSAASFTTTTGYGVQAFGQISYAAGVPQIFDARGIATVVDTGVGMLQVVWNTPFADAYYTLALSARRIGVNALIVNTSASIAPTAGTCDLTIHSDDGTWIDPTTVYIMAMHT